ncbi:MAG TPA: bacteriohemerythrin, partial [Gallionella sp.]|nr:bacteriohemerythrin [Gallionella sp.]
MRNKTEQIDVFPWKRNFKTGIPLLDRQHRKLVGLLNRLAIMPLYGSSKTELSHTIDELSAYAASHFEAEEAIWKPVFREDEWLLNHQGTHSTFISRIAEFREKAKSGRSEALSDHILRFMIHWLALHILDDDMRMAKVWHAANNGLNLAHAKQRADREMSGSLPTFIETLLDMYEDLSARTLEQMREQFELTKTEEALKLSEQHERAFSDTVINSIPGLLYLYDDQFRLMRWNQRHVDELGYPEEELRGKYVLDFFEESKHEQVRNRLATLSTGKRVEVKEEVRKKDGSKTPYLLTGVPLNIGGKHCFLGTGIDISELKRAERELERRAQETKDTLIGTVIAVSKAMWARDPYTAGHQQRVADISVAIAEKLGLDPYRIEGLRLGASVHDIGKLAIPVELLVKPARLTQLEYGVIQTHPQAGADILKEICFPWPILEIISQHHERLDGTGYPHGLSGEEICIEVCIVAVADVFEAMSSHRPYRPALGLELAIEELECKRDCTYDASVVDALLQLLDENPRRFTVS